MYRCLLVLVCLAALPLSNVHAQWGTLTGTFILDGDAPQPKPILVTKDEAVCGVHGLVEENLTVNPDNKGIANIVIYVSVGRGEKAPDIHPSYEETAKADVHLDNLNCRFEPRVALLRTGQTLVVGNKDSVGHNVKIDSTANVPINPIIPANGEIRQVYTKEERMPVSASCSIHPWMSAKVVVKDTPYMAVTDQDGKFTIENLPQGQWTFQVWHEAGWVDEVKLNGKATKWNRGRMEQKISSDINDLGQILVPLSVLK